LILYLLPLLSVLATILLNSYVSTIPQFIVLAAIAVIAGLTISGKFIGADMYPIAVVSISLSLLFHYSLAGYYINGFDSRIEYYMQNLVVKQGFWDPYRPAHDYNSMLAVTILPAIYSTFVKVDGTAVFKIIWPILFSLASLCLYQAYRQQIAAKNAFLAVLYFTIITTVVASMITIPRQEIAIFFLTLLVLLLLDKELPKLHRVILYMIFSMSIVVSHYTSAYFLIFCIAGALVIFPLFKRKGYLISYGFATLLVVATFAWYMFTTNSSIFSALVNVGTMVSHVFITEILNISSRETVFMLSAKVMHPLMFVTRYLMLLFQVFVAVGLGAVILKYKSIKLDNDYFALSLVSFLVLVACVVVPYLSDFVGVERIYALATPLLAPFWVFGGELSLQLLGPLFVSWKRLLRSWWNITEGAVHEFWDHSFDGGMQINSLANHAREKMPQALLCLLLLVFFLLSSGFIIDLAGLKQWYMNLSFPGTTIMTSFSRTDTAAGEWLIDHIDYSRPVYADSTGHMFFFAYQGPDSPVKTLLWDQESMLLSSPLQEDAYLYLRGVNLQQRIIRVEAPSWLSYKRGMYDVNLDDAINLMSLDKVYANNGGSEVFKGRK
jgi:uncharacterized membrane protein